jgi:predicted transcriptional regulator
MADEKGRTGLEHLRKAGRVTELLFLYEIATRPYARLKPIADTLGVSVQATSFLYRELSRQGFVQSVEGRYRPTVAGIAFLHASLNNIRDDLDERLAHLLIVRRCRAVAAANVKVGESVSLAMEDGILKVRPGRTGASTGRAAHSARSGELLEVVDLEGILPLVPGKVLCLVVPLSAVESPSARTKLSQELKGVPYGLIAAEGLEAYHLLQRVTKAHITRFGVAASAREASQVGVPVVVAVTDDRLPLLLSSLSEKAPEPPVEVRSLVPPEAVRKRAPRRARPVRPPQ